jgi:Fe2+ or Zn2+ uptake regulation protein
LKGRAILKNFSRQREAVLTALCSTKSHPTAAWIYEQARKTLPNISLGTVYRNLSVLEREGIIRKISVGDASEHFDGDISSHSHFYCKQCEEITDIPFDSTDACRKVEQEIGGCVEVATYTFTGVCKKCLLGDKS